MVGNRDDEQVAARAEVREAAQARSAEQARRAEERLAARADVQRRARAAGWTTHPAALWYAVAVAAGAVTYLVIGADSVGRPLSLLWMAGPVAAMVLVLVDLWRGPLPSPRRTEAGGARWAVPIAATIVGALLGVVAGAVAGGIASDAQGCGSQTFGDCGAGLALLSLIVGPFVVVALATLALALARIRHALVIAVLGLTAATGVIGLALAVLPDSPNYPVLGAAGGAVASGLAGTACARAWSPASRTTAVAVILLLPYAAALA